MCIFEKFLRQENQFYLENFQSNINKKYEKSHYHRFFTSISISGIHAQTAGTLTVSVATSSTGGNYAPKNVVAIWVEDAQGNFVKTLLAYAANRKTHLNTWEASTTAAGSPFNTVDAITGATKTSHATRTCTWNGMDVNGTLVADGSYKLRMELTDKNNTGNFSTFTFTKGVETENLTPANVPSFASISIVWDPLFASVEDNSFAESYKVYPNPSTGVFNITGKNVKAVEIRNVAGAIIFEGTSSSIDLSQQPDGIYYLEITTEKGPITKKIMKNGF